MSVFFLQYLMFLVTRNLNRKQARKTVWKLFSFLQFSGVFWEIQSSNRKWKFFRSRFEIGFHYFVISSDF